MTQLETRMDFLGAALKKQITMPCNIARIVLCEFLEIKILDSHFLCNRCNNIAPSWSCTPSQITSAYGTYCNDFTTDVKQSWCSLLVQYIQQEMDFFIMHLATLS